MPVTRSQSHSVRAISVSSGCSVASKAMSTPESHGTRFGGVFSETINGNILPKLHLRTQGTTFGLLFSMTGAKEVRTNFRSTNTVHNAPEKLRGQRYVHFIDHFSKELRCDKLYVVVVVFRLRSYLVAGTFDVDLPDENQAIKALGCTGSFRGDLAICFYGMNRTNDLLYGMPRFPSSQERDEVLKAVVDRFVKHVRSVAVDGANLKTVIGLGG